MVKLIDYAWLAKRFESASWRGGETVNDPMDY